MTRFIALLAIVSGLLLVDSASACTRPMQRELYNAALGNRFAPIEMRDTEARRYLQIINEEPPVTDLVADHIIILTLGDMASVVPVMGSIVCAGDFLIYDKDTHERAMKYAKGE